MSFSINESKVEELVRASRKSYEISGSDLPMTGQSENYSGSQYYVASGATYSPPTLVTAETRAHFADLRHQIEESGAPLGNEEQLAREIDAMRHRY